MGSVLLVLAWIWSPVDGSASKTQMGLDSLHAPKLYLETTKFLCCSFTDTYTLGKTVRLLGLPDIQNGPNAASKEWSKAEAEASKRCWQVRGSQWVFASMLFSSFVLVPHSKPSLVLFCLFHRVRARCHFCAEPILRLCNHILVYVRGRLHFASQIGIQNSSISIRISLTEIYFPCS